MKRFWNRAEAVAQEGGFAILLDGKAVNLPGAGALVVQAAGLAEAVAGEWQAAGATFTPDDLVLTRLASTARIRVPAHRAAIVRQLAAHGLNDLLCYRAAGQPALAAREAAAWDPWLDWAARTFGVRLAVGAGIVPIVQPPHAEAAFRDVLAAMPDGDLAGLGVIVPALGSLALGVAVAAGALAPAAACDLAELDALWQAEQWGEDEAAAARRRTIAADVAVAARFMVLSRS